MAAPDDGITRTQTVWRFCNSSRCQNSNNAAGCWAEEPNVSSLQVIRNGTPSPAPTD